MSTALVVIDVQNGLFIHDPQPLDGDAVVARINRLAQAARSRKFPVIFIQHDGTAAENLLPFTEGWKLHRDLEVGPRDVTIRKTTCDAFFETALEPELRKRDVTRLILAGYATEFCLDSTLRNACSKGFQVIVAADAHTTNDNPILKAKQVIDHQNWAWANVIARPPIQVLTTDQLISRLAATAP